MTSQPSGRRELGLVTATALVIGNMVGSGIFLLPSSLAPYGVYSLWGWGITSVGAMLLAWSFSRLARRLPRAGGPYAYTRAGFGDFMGFLIAWGYWISIVASNAAIAVALASYLSDFFPALARTPLFGGLAALGAVWILTLINIRGIDKAAFVQVVTVVLKLSPLLVLALFGIWYFQPVRFLAIGPEQTPLGAANAAAALTLWAFLGLEAATVPAQHVRDANRTIPRATLLGCAIAAVFYITCTTVIMGVMPGDQLAHSTAPFADAAKHIWGAGAGYVIAATAVIACFGTLNGWIMLSGQVPEAAANDALFPRAFARQSRHGTPATGLILSSVLVSLLVMMNYTRGLVALFTFIIQLATLSTLVPYIFCTLAEFVMGSDAEPTQRIGWPAGIGLALAFAFSLWAVAGTGQAAVYWGFLALLCGLPVYAWQRRRRVAAD